LLALVVGAGTWTWMATPSVASIPGWYWPALVGTICLAIFTAVRPWYARWLAPAYALAEGALLGVISKLFDEVSDGVVGQALLATLVTFVVMLTLYASGIVRVTSKLRRVVLGATAGAAAFYLGWFVLSLFGGPGLFGGGLIAIGISVVMITIAAFNLAIDFDAIDRGVAAGEPAELEWAAAFGLIVTLVWIYLEFLRLIAILGGRD
jgi:uncharacterized YccA/Bax inhibitor family protein